MNPNQLVFLLGHPLGHTLSPPMQNAAFRKMGLPWTYVPLDISLGQVEDAVRLARAFNVRGANVTVPYKAAVIPYLDFVEPEAKWMKSVNTIYRKGSKLAGASTDGEGFLRSLGIRRKKIRGSRGLILGAGGTAKAVAAALAGEGVRGFCVANRTFSRAEELVRSLRRRHRRLDAACASLKEAEKLLPDCDWVIQTTSVGLHKGDPSLLPLKGARKGVWVVDLIYHRRTAFLEEAKRRGIFCQNGLGMLLHQGALSLERWTGRSAPLAVMEKALLKKLPGLNSN